MVFVGGDRMGRVGGVVLFGLCAALGSGTHLLGWTHALALLALVMSLALFLLAQIADTDLAKAAFGSLGHDRPLSLGTVRSADLVEAVLVWRAGAYVLAWLLGWPVLISFALTDLAHYLSITARSPWAYLGWRALAYGGFCLAGLMVGRTPEYLGKKIEALEIKYAVIGVVLPCAVILLFSAIACTTEGGLSSLLSKGPHGLSEILYAFTSGAGNNGSAFAGLNANTSFYNILISLAMVVGRFGVILPVLFISGSLARKKCTPQSAGTFVTQGTLFTLLLCSVILILGSLTFFPALCLGPIMEHLMMIQGRVF
jgi:hypothetical protein